MVFAVSVHTCVRLSVCVYVLVFRDMRMFMCVRKGSFFRLFVCMHVCVCVCVGVCLFACVCVF